MTRQPPEVKSTHTPCPYPTRFRLEMPRRCAAADRSGALPLVQVSDRLTWLAESLVDAALTRAWDEMRALYGEPLRGDGERAGFAVIAYGKFGEIGRAHV